MKKLPVIVSIPHGGMAAPKELQDRLCIDKHNLFDDIDPFTHEIYNLSGKVVDVIKTEIARTFVDLNRAADDLPPANPDGVIKSITCDERPIYIEGKEPDAKLIKLLLKNYHAPYHQRLKKANQRHDIDLILDCHSMAAVGPAISPDPGKTRPMICLGNVRGNSCSNSIVEKLAACFKSVFDLQDNEVTINQPFAGGYITRTYGRKPLPWVQVEISRALYLKEPWFDRNKLEIDKERLRELNKMFYSAIRRYFS